MNKRASTWRTPGALARPGRGLGWLVGLGIGLASGWVNAAPQSAAPRAVAPAVVANPMADIADVYTWMTGSNLNLVMDLSPLDDGSHSFGTQVQYVFHVTSKAGLGFNAPAGTETRVILQFHSNTSVEAWVTDAAGATTKDYVTGDPSTTAGVTSIRGKIRVFAGPRSDPRFFSTSGMTAGLTALGADLVNIGTPKNSALCPTLSAPATIRAQLTSGADAFDKKNVMAIVVQVDKSLVNATGNTTVAVWGSTHAGS